MLEIIDLIPRRALVFLFEIGVDTRVPPKTLIYLLLDGFSGIKYSSLNKLNPPHLRLSDGTPAAAYVDRTFVGSENVS